MIDARFPTYTPGSRRLYQFEDAGELRLLLSEIHRTMEAAASSASARQAKGALTREQTDRISLLWLAVAQDLEALVVEGVVTDRLTALRASNGVAWAEKVEALRGEIEARRSSQEAEIAKGRLTAADAKAQLERLEAVHDLYWRQGFAFDGTRDELRAMTGPILDYDVEQDGPATVQPCGDSSRAEQPAHPPEDSGATPLPRSTTDGEKAEAA